jgi:hypothetical protein
LRLLSQDGNSRGVIANYKNVVSWLERNKEYGKVAPIFSRAGVAYAVLDNPKESLRCFRLAAEWAQNANEHQQVTVNVLWAMAHTFRNVGFAEDPLSTVINAQSYYLTNSVDGHLAQAYPLKSTFQCLFAEAAMHLFGGTPEKGYLRLAAASMVRRRAFSHPAAEGFAELLTLIPTTPMRDLLRRAMDPAEHAIPNREMRPFLKQCTELIPLFAFGYQDWEKMRWFLDEQERILVN